MEQLRLTIDQLLRIGFTPKQIKGDDFNKDRTIYKIDFLNGCIYCNPEEEVYTWYHKIILGDVSNYTLLDITSKQSLYIFLSCIKVKYNLIID